MNYSILLFWKIGKKVYEEEKKCENAIKKYADYYSYYYGNSIIFTRENVHMMRRLYLNFPIFYERLESISWEQYLLLFQIMNKKERWFYFYLSILFHSDFEGTIEFIKNRYYFRI